MLKKLSSSSGKIYNPDEKTVRLSQILQIPSMYDKSSRSFFLQRVPEQTASRNHSKPRKPTPFPSTPKKCRAKSSKRNFSAFTNFSGDGDDAAKNNVESGKSLEQTTSKIIKKDEKFSGKTDEVFRKVMESFQDLSEANKVEKAKIVLFTLKFNLFCMIHKKT